MVDCALGRWWIVRLVVGGRWCLDGPRRRQGSGTETGESRRLVAVVGTSPDGQTADFHNECTDGKPDWPSDWWSPTVAVVNSTE
jgi:hypothetical protein